MSLHALLALPQTEASARRSAIAKLISFFNFTKKRLNFIWFFNKLLNTIKSRPAQRQILYLQLTSQLNDLKTL